MNDSVLFADLHRHIEGSIRPETVFDLARRFGIPLPASNVRELRPHLTVNEQGIGLLAFLARFRLHMSALGDLDACRRVAAECVEDAASEGLDYLEARFSPAFMADHHRLDPCEVAAAVIDGIKAASARTGLRVALIGTLSRGYGARRAMRELEAILAHRADFVAIDLAGDEERYPCAMFGRHFALARDAGLAVTVHAGEARGAESVREAVERLGATRIGHGTRAIEDPAVMRLLARRGIGIECCLTSNLQTGATASHAAHPLRLFLEAGIPATINTDDPAISGINLRHEFDVAASAAGLDIAMIRQAQANAARIAFAWPDRAYSEP